jgi:hypothetical protein
MNPTLLVDSMLTFLLCAGLLAGGAVALWLLPWTDADRDGTVRAIASTARRAGEVVRPRAPFRALPAR